MMANRVSASLNGQPTPSSYKQIDVKMNVIVWPSGSAHDHLLVNNIVASEGFDSSLHFNKSACIYLIHDFHQSMCHPWHAAMHSHPAMAANIIVGRLYYMLL